MEHKTQISELMAKSDAEVSALAAQQREQHLRAKTFRDFLSANNGLESSVRRQIESLLAKSEESAKDISIKIADARIQKNALTEIAGACKVQISEKKIQIKRPIPPPRLHDFDYRHKELREGTDIYRVRELLRKNGKPMLLAEIVVQLFGPEETDPRTGKYASLRGTITGYAKQNRVFTIESKSPHVIGLIEFNNLRVSDGGDPWNKL